MKPNPNIILGFDFGMKYLGIAVGQKISKTASPLSSLKMKNGSPDWEQITTLIAKWQPGELIVGLPLNMDGTSQPIAEAAKSFTDDVAQRYQLPTYLVDERLSTWEAKNRLNIRKDVTLKKREIDKVNSFAAMILIEQWLQEID